MLQSLLPPLFVILKRTREGSGAGWSAAPDKLRGVLIGARCFGSTLCMTSQPVTTMMNNVAANPERGGLSLRFDKPDVAELHRHPVFLKHQRARRRFTEAQGGAVRRIKLAVIV